MIPIPWNEEIVDKTLEYYSQWTWLKNQLYGFVAENLVRNYYGLEPQFNSEPDEGWDLEIDGLKIDVKNHITRAKAFKSTLNYWTINCTHGLRADRYFCTVMHPAQKQMALIGYIDPGEIHLQCKWYRKGAEIELKYYSFTAGSNCYFVKCKHLNKFSQESATKKC